MEIKFKKEIYYHVDVRGVLRFKATVFRDRFDNATWKPHRI
jgi:hypothetical protein